ncbi:MAG: four helix bundle protein [Acidobacteriota bacterium]|jgi:four helix bundle protein|nr:four helix bundle protein [Acidobacteriota bacterium]
MAAKHYKELIVWQKAMDLVYLVYQATKSFPKDELYGLTSQIRRAAVSVPSNIADGQARKSTAEFRNFLSVARGSMAEVETQLLIALRLNYTQESQLREIMAVHDEVSKMLFALTTKLATGH